MQYTETELAKLIETVEQEFTTHLNKAEAVHNAALVKSEGSAAETLVKAEDSKKESKPEEKEAKAPESKEEAPKETPAAEAKPEAKEAAPAAPAEEKPAAPAAGHGYDEEDMAHMLKMYQSMSKEELLAHHDCVRQCLDAMSAKEAPAAPEADGLDKCGTMAMGKSEPTDKGSPTNTEYEKNSGGKIEASAPGKTPGAKSPASKAEGMQMEKTENTEMELVKSELEAEKAKSAELKKSFDKATELLTNLVKKVTVPQGKAITEMSALTKGEGQEETKQLSKSEVSEALKKKDFSKLTKSDRDLINDFYFDKTDFKTISHLLKN